MKTTRYARTSALPAIAAVLALSSTSALAQEAQPVTVAPPSSVAADPPPVVETAPLTTETTEPVAETSEPAVAPVAAKPVKRATRTAAVKTAAPASRAVSRPSPAAAPVAAPATAPVADPVAAVATAPAARPAPVAPVKAEAQPAKTDNTVPIAAGGALAFLALGGAAVAMTRRRRHEEDEEVWIDEEPVETMGEPDSVAPSAPVVEEQPLIVGPSAFSWGNERAATTKPAAVQPSAETTADDDRLPGESWVERAYRGPTPNNPSVSLRNRLRRAAFFDKRERDVAAGHAEPVDMTAGLPDAMVEEQEREREFA